MRSLPLAAAAGLMALAAVSFAQTPDRAEPGSVIDFRLPAAGRATLVINDATGVRVRNLIADTPFAAGEQHIRWDGLDDAGKPVPVGTYHWAGLYRGDLHAVYRGSFTPGNPPWPFGSTGGWTADHSYPTTILAVGGDKTGAGQRILIGSSESEWGHGLIACDLDGRKLWGIRWLSGKTWAAADTVVAAGGKVFATSYPAMNSVWEVDPGSGENRIVFERADLPKDLQSTTSRFDSPEFPGTTLRVIGGRKVDGENEGELFVEDLSGQQPRTYVLATHTERKKDRLALLRTLPVRPWSVAFLSDGRCVAAMDQSVDLLDPQTGQTKPFITGLSAPYAVTVDAKDRIFVSDQGDDDIRFNPNSKLVQRALRTSTKPAMQVKIYDASGKFLRAIGKEGGRSTGAFKPEDLSRPASLTIDARGRLWLTEFTFAPKRVSVWDVSDDLAKNAPTLARQFVGPTTYGGGAAMIDPAKPWQIMDTNYGVLFDVDLTAHTYNPIAVPWRQYLGRKENSYRPLLPFDGKPTTVFTIDGKRYGILQGGYEHGPEAHWQPYTGGADATVIGEYRDDRFVPLAAIGNLRMLLRSRELSSRTEEQWLPTPILEAARKLPNWTALATAAGMDPALTDAPHVKHVRGSSVWIASPWPYALSGFIWTDVNADGQMQSDEIQLFELKDTDAITFDRQLNACMAEIPRSHAPTVTYKLPRQGFTAAGVPIYQAASLQTIPGRIEAVEVGAEGSLLCMDALFDSTGRRLWSYPAGGPAKSTPKEELLAPGRMGRLHSFQGIVNAPNDLGQVSLIHSTDGMSYLLTRDGLFLATLFKPFNCAKGWDEIPEAKLGMNLEDYSLQDECFNGSLAQAQATGKGFEKGHYYLLGLGRSAVLELTGLESAHRLPGGDLKLATAAPGPAIAARTRPAPDRPLLANATYGDPVRYADSATSVSWDKDALHLKWIVSKDETPMINNDKDWTLLFSTGDACDLQLTSPRLGKCRYLITVFNGEPVVIRYQFDAKPADRAVTFKSGVLETRIGIVERLDLKPQITRAKGSYEVEVALPWTLLEIEPKRGEKIPFELGVIRSNAAGTRAVSRDYWHSGESGMVSDTPTEARPTEKWGTLQLR